MQPYLHHAKYYETDQMGIIHHSNYIRWMEEARIEILKQAGISYKEMEEKGIISPVLAVTCEYKSMVHFDDEVLIYVKLSKYNGVKFEVEYEMRDKMTGELRTLGRSNHCFLDGNGRPLSLKRSFPEVDKKFVTLMDEV